MSAMPFFSECPRCGQERPQTGYPREELEELIGGGAEIECYCGNCDQYWPLATEERADLARAISRR